MSDNSYWKLEVHVGTCAGAIYGNEEVLSSALDEWKAWCANTVRDANALLEVNGICDNSDRAPVKHVYKMELIDAMTLVRQW